MSKGRPGSFPEGGGRGFCRGTIPLSALLQQVDRRGACRCAERLLSAMCELPQLSHQFFCCEELRRTIAEQDVFDMDS